MWRIPVLIRYLLWYKWFLTDFQTKYGQWYGFVVFPVDGQVAQRDGRDGAPHGTCNAFTTDLDSADLGNLRRRFNEQYSQIANLLLGQARETTIGFKDLFTGVSRAKSQRQPASVVACTVVQEYVATLSEWQFQFASRAMLCKASTGKRRVISVVHWALNRYLLCREKEKRAVFPGARRSPSVLCRKWYAQAGKFKSPNTFW